MTETTDITIIGAGPAGLFAAFYAGMRQLSVRIIDTLPKPGGQPYALYPNKYIYDIGGIPKISGKELAEQALEQLTPFNDNIQWSLNEQVTGFEKLDDSEGHFTVYTDKKTYQTGAIIIATGGGVFSPRPLRVSGLTASMTDQIHYYPKDYRVFENQEVAVLGGGNSALDEALAISHYAKHVTLIHRRNQFRGLEHSVETLKTQDNVDILTPYTPDTIFQNSDSQVLDLSLKSRQEKPITLNLDHIVVAYGFSGKQSGFEKWPITIEHHGIPVSALSQTSLPGVYAVGDIAEYPGKAQLITEAYGEVPKAINDIVHFLHPDAKVNKLHSTTVFDH